MSKWYGIPKTEITPEVRTHFQMLRLRGILDPKRRYKGGSSRVTIPKFSHMGTVVDGPASRQAGPGNTGTGGSLTEQTMKSEDLQRRLKAKYSAIQAAKQSGRSRRKNGKR